MECIPLPRVSMSASPDAAVEAEISAPPPLCASRLEALLLMDSSAPMAVAGPGPLSAAAVGGLEVGPQVVGRRVGLGMVDGAGGGAPGADQAVLWLFACLSVGGGCDDKKLS